MGRRSWVWLTSAALLGCGSPATVVVGDFTVHLEDGPPLRIERGPLTLDLAEERSFSARRVRNDYEAQYGSFRLTRTELAGARGAARLSEVATEDGLLTAVFLDDGEEPLADLLVAPAGESLRIQITPRGDENESTLAFRFDGGPVLGFGAQTHDVDHRGQRVPVFVSEQGIGKVETDEPADVWFLVGTRHQSYLSVPTCLLPRAEASFGLHATTLHRSSFDLGASDPTRLEVTVGEGPLTLLVAPGPTPLAVIRQQTEHLGRIKPPPDWTFGVWMEAIGGTGAVRAEAEALRRAHIPASAIWSEDWRGGARSGREYILEEDWRADPVLYAGLKELIDGLHADGFRFQSYFNTFVVEGVDVAAELAPHLVRDPRGQALSFSGNTFEPTGLADLFLEEHRAWVRDELAAALRAGHDGWMADFAEWYPPDAKLVAPSDGRPAEAAHHHYPVAWAEVNQEAIAAAGRDDVVIFHRSGYSGAQGQAQVIWAGDQRTSFQPDDGLPTVVPIMIGLGVTGFPVVTHDIGGYASATNPPTDKALFFRWTSLGALSAVMRTHHGRNAFENWRWDHDAETVAHFRRWSELHTRLWPYLAGLAEDAVSTGAPLVRPLIFADPGDVRLAAVKDAYLLGPDLLVAPVLTASTAQREVRLPKGRWFPFLGGDPVEGGGEPIVVSAPLTELPIFVRAGAVIPTLPEGIESLVPAAEVLDLPEARARREVWIWLGASGEGRDVGGARDRLESPGPVVGPLRAPEAVEVVSAEDRALSVRVPANGTFSFVDGADQAHVVTRVGHDAQAETLLRFRW